MSEVSTIFTVHVFQRAHGTPVAVIIVLASVSVLKLSRIIMYSSETSDTDHKHRSDSDP